ncbi:unnamed protein product [Lactuca virosa]|uniref:Ubiquitin carboxyl-terminal hydrolase 7 ICP0-binding domain-containing protein n=1 Tax=Lactuca virosa TaxID=75947 RepID=A0AAU9MHA3_9ASTR|nr:unnamed protein product [Lactuca virosa]
MIDHEIKFEPYVMCERLDKIRSFRSCQNGMDKSKLHTYDDVTERVARQLGLDDPTKIRLTPQNCYSQQPKPHPIKFRVAEHLLDMLVHYNQPMILNIRLPKQRTVGDVLNEIKTKIFPLTQKIENINDQYWTLCAEELSWQPSTIVLDRHLLVEDIVYVFLCCYCGFGNILSYWSNCMYLT